MSWEVHSMSSILRLYRIRSSVLLPTLDLLALNITIDSRSVVTLKVFYTLHIYIVYDIHLYLFTYDRSTEYITWGMLAYYRTSSNL